jgi:hypothetical protein
MFEDYDWRNNARSRKVQKLYLELEGKLLRASDMNWINEVTKDQIKGLHGSIRDHAAVVERSSECGTLTSIANGTETAVVMMGEMHVKLVEHDAEPGNDSLYGLSEAVEPIEKILHRHGLVLAVDILLPHVLRHLNNCVQLTNTCPTW